MRREEAVSWHTLGHAALSAGLLIVQPIVALRLPIPRTPRPRLLEAALVGCMLTTAENEHIADWLRAHPGALLGLTFSILVRLVRGLTLLGPTIDSASPASASKLGAHRFYALPLLAFSVTTLWNCARNVESMGTWLVLLGLFLAVLDEPKPLQRTILLSGWLLLGPALLGSLPQPK